MRREGEGRLRRWLPVLALALGCAPAAPQGPPHVLLLSIDTLRPDYLSLNGYDRETSPFLDELLGSGFYFERAVSPVPRTTPALASLLTGTYPHRSGVRTLTGTLSDDVTTLAELMRGQRYQTLAVVTNRVLKRERGLARGFDVYDSASALRVGSATAREALRYLETVDRSRPLFAWVHLIDPHLPYHPESGLAEGFDPGYTGRFRLNFGVQPRDGEPASRFRTFPEELNLGETRHRNALPEPENAHVRRLYAADIRGTDAAVRELVAGFRAVFGERLLIVVAADHGESLGEHDFYFDHGDYVYGAGTRVPLGFVLPRGHPLHGSGRCSQWVSLVDVVPTLLELLAIEPAPELAERLEGRSLVPCMRGEELADEPVFSESGHSYFPALVRRRVRHDVSGRFRAVTLDDWKLIWTPYQTGDLEWELYDLRADPGETRNLYAPDHPRLPALRAALEAWLARAEAQPGEAPLSEEDREALRALGYLP